MSGAERSDPAGRSEGWRWVVLAVGLGAMTAGCAFQFGLPYLLPALRADGVALGQASFIVACPMAGLMATLILWGATADRIGERTVLWTGLAIAGVALLVAAALAEYPLALAVALVLAGAGGGSVHSASGRLILGWFGPRERGTAMGIRQTAQPLGVAVAALSLPPLAYFGLDVPLLALAAFCLAMSFLVVLLIRNPARPPEERTERTGNPYGTPVLWRLHTASAALVVPQFTVTTFSLVYLVDEHGWEAAQAGRLLAAIQLCGALARIAAGLWSDRAGSRLRPYRLLAVAITLVMVALAAGAHAGSAVAIVVLLVASVLTVSPNGLAFTAVAEYAGRAWSGRAMGIQNTVQNGAAMLTPPVIGAVVSAVGYATAFSAAAAFPLAAIALVPVRAEPRVKVVLRKPDLPQRAE